MPDSALVTYSRMIKLSHSIFALPFALAAAVLDPRRYAWLEPAVRARCETLGIRYVDLNPLLRARAAAEQWLWVDRAHLTDDGNALVAALLVEAGVAA